MLFMRTVFFLMLAVVLIAGGYLMLYNRMINRRMQGGVSGRRLPSPGQLALHVLAICAAAVIVLGCFSSAPSSVNTQNMRSWLRVFSAEELQDSWAGAYSQEANPGYTRTEVQDGAFSFIIFESETPYDGLHPDFLVFIHHIGNFEAEAMSWYGNFVFTADGKASGVGAGSSASAYYLAVGAAEAGALFTLDAAAYSDIDYAKALDSIPGQNDAWLDPATARGSVTISLHGGISP